MNKEPLFTSGPWEVDEPIKSIATGELMYHVKGPNLVTDFEDWGFTKADAHLIATAPELYEALVKAEPILRDALGAIGKILVERDRGMGYFHAEVDWLVNRQQEIRDLLKNTNELIKIQGSLDV